MLYESILLSLRVVCSYYYYYYYYYYCCTIPLSIFIHSTAAKNVQRQNESSWVGGGADVGGNSREHLVQLEAGTVPPSTWSCFQLSVVIGSVRAHFTINRLATIHTYWYIPTDS